MYGTQTSVIFIIIHLPFENDVKMYGTQTKWVYAWDTDRFENDVKMYGTQTSYSPNYSHRSLRMM